MGNGNEETEKSRHNVGRRGSLEQKLCSRTGREEENCWTSAHTGGTFIVDRGHKESWSHRLVLAFCLLCNRSSIMK